MIKLLNNKDFITTAIPIEGYHVTYCLFKSIKKHPWNGISNPYTDLNNDNIRNNLEKSLYKVIDTNCFSNLCNILKLDATKGYNRIIYLFKKHSKLSDKECLDWLILAKQNKLLPRYINVKKVLQNSNVVFDYSGITKNLLYVYLTIIRMLVEEPKFVKNILILINKYNINYFASFIAAKYFGFNNFGHAFCQPSNVYPYTTVPNTLYKIQLNKILGLYRFIQKNCPDMPHSSSFSANNRVKTLSSSELLLDINKLINLNIDDVLNAATDNEAEKILKNKLS